MARAKSTSRNARVGNAVSQLNHAAETLATLKDMIEASGGEREEGVKPTAEQVIEWGKTLSAEEDLFSQASSEVESVADEMRQWEENTAENFSQTDKYQRVSEAADALESARDTLQGIDWPSVEAVDLATLIDHIDEAVTELENAAGDLDGVDCPSMFG